MKDNSRLHGDLCRVTLYLFTVFNIAVDAVVRQWLAGGCNLDIAHHGQGCTLQEKGETFYSDDRRITRMDSGWVQESFGEIAWLFE